MSLRDYFSNNKIFTGTEKPTQGKFDVGDIIVNIGPNSAEEPMWICVEAGTPGVWELCSGVNAELSDEQINEIIKSNMVATKDYTDGDDIQINDVNPDIVGDIDNLQTDDKTNIVSAINEIVEKSNIDYLTETELSRLEYLHVSNLIPSNIITTGVDLNTIEQNCCLILWTSANCLNLPPGENGGSSMFKCSVTYQNNNIMHVVQEFWRVTKDTPRYFFRVHNGGDDTWSDWVPTGGTCKISNGSIDNLMTTGNYYITRCTTGPVVGNSYYVEVLFENQSYGYQRATQFKDGDDYLPKYERTYYNGKWTAWRYL